MGSSPHTDALLPGPDRYPVSRRANQSDYLIYNFSPAVSVAPHITNPPHKSLSGVVIIDASRRLIVMIK